MSFTIFKIKFEVSYLFVSMVIIYIALDRTGYIIPLIISVIAHETAHILCLMLFRCRLLKVSFLIGTLSVQYDNLPSDKAKMLSLFCGPFINLIISLISYMIGNYTWFAINFLTFFYNLLPVSGLDGGEMLEIILEKLINHKLVVIIMMISTIVVCLSFCITCFFFTNNFSLLILCFYLISLYIFKNILKDKRI